MKHKFLLTILCFGLLTLYFACQKENTDEPTTQKKYSAPSITSAKQFVDSEPSSTSVALAKSSGSTISVTHWQGSETKKYKQTLSLDVDILYTPIYVDSPRTDIKGFIATTEHNGIVDSRKFYILYKSNDLSNGLNAYVLIYRLDGQLEWIYNFVDGQDMPLQEHNSGTVSAKSSVVECDGVNMADLTDEEFENWWANCTGVALNEVTVTAPLSNDSGIMGGSALNDWNSGSWFGIEIPAIINPGGSGYNNGSINGDATIDWHSPNVTIATAASISLVLEADYSSATANWLRQMEQDDQQLLNQIADFLNNNREQNPFSDFTFNHIQPEQFPVSDEAIAFILDLIDVLDDSPGINPGDLNELFECMSETNNLEECLFEENISIEQLTNQCANSILANNLLGITDESVYTNFLNEIRNTFFNDPDVTLRFKNSDNVPDDANAATGFDEQSDIDSGT